MNTSAYITHNSADLDINDTSYQGNVTATYQELCDLFGTPHDGDGYKTDAEWDVQFSDGTVATIYNWKDGINYCGDDGTPTKKIKEWHVGGKTRAAADKVQIAIDLYREEKEAPKSDIEQALNDAHSIYDTLKATKGEAFASTVEVANYVQKLLELNSHLAGIIVANGAMGEREADALMEAVAVMGSRIIGRFSKAAGLPPEQRVASDVMEWASRISKAEQQIAEKVVADFKSKGKDL